MVTAAAARMSERRMKKSPTERRDARREKTKTAPYQRRAPVYATTSAAVPDSAVCAK
jgi:hypothetical protein